MAADITLINLNMLYVRYYDSVEKELHVPLGTLYLTRILEDAGYEVDFRDYQLNSYDDPFDAENICDYLADSADLVGVSVMANLLPFTLVALQTFKERNPDKTVVLGGVGPKSVEHPILERFPWIDAIAYGEGERMIVPLVEQHRSGRGFAEVPNMIWRGEAGQGIVVNPPADRVEDLDSIPFPAWHRIDLARYEGYGVMTSRGCPYPCTFCSVAPIWGHTAHHRSNANILAEMSELKQRAGVDLFLFQDEFFVSTPGQVISFCDDLERTGLGVDWKAFGRVNLSEPKMMERMAGTGCLELRFGIESGSDTVLAQTRKGFSAEQAVAVVSEGVHLFDRVDAFYVWGFPYETMDDFHQSVFQMISFRMMGARILPSLLCFLPQTQIYRELNGHPLEFCRELFPEYMLTGHEICRSARVQIDAAHASIFDFIEQHPDIFPGFFHYDLVGNVWPKLKVLQEMGFYPADAEDVELTDSCGAHSPRVAQATTAKAQLTAG
jgi:anaerobic magnesium-protoporphyrin IX monomethyl ester cyclase